MSTKLYWRQPQLSDTAHLSESAAHRALCAEDVLTAFTDSDVPRHAACVTCLAIAERSGLRRPPFSKPAIPDLHTRELIFNDKGNGPRQAAACRRSALNAGLAGMEKTMDNTIETWAQGYFVDQPQYRNWSAEAKADANSKEALNVRPSPTGNAICRTIHPDAAEWIAQRLNMAAKLEALAHKLHTAEATNDQKEWLACIDAIYRTAHLPANTEAQRPSAEGAKVALERLVGQDGASDVPKL